ncbi:hypothetical protein B0H14DRAFT_3490372 [Mycena olivaceomarginata]|nr:hypothetical protein B0H14DRAFT_3490372 [Mycena olivaceomarginata]
MFAAVDAFLSPLGTLPKRLHLKQSREDTKIRMAKAHGIDGAMKDVPRTAQEKESQKSRRSFTESFSIDRAGMPSHVTRLYRPSRPSPPARTKTNQNQTLATPILMSLTASAYLSLSFDLAASE